MKDYLVQKMKKNCMRKRQNVIYEIYFQKYERRASQNAGLICAQIYISSVTQYSPPCMREVSVRSNLQQDFTCTMCLGQCSICVIWLRSLYSLCNLFRIRFLLVRSVQENLVLVRSDQDQCCYTLNYCSICDVCLGSVQCRCALSWNSVVPV